MPLRTKTICRILLPPNLTPRNLELALSHPVLPMVTSIPQQLQRQSWVFGLNWREVDLASHRF